MKKNTLLLPFFLFAFCCANAQSNVRAWYADGQVWVVWEVDFPVPLTCSVYAKPTSFTSTNNAVLLGRPFGFEYLPWALKEQVDTSATFRIPDGMGGTYQLSDSEGLFVATPHQAGSLYFAVVAEGETTVTAGVNITDAAVPFNYDPVADPVECHVQATFLSPFAAGYICRAYMMWCDGRQNYWESRPDFPVMANAAKNGMPGMFLVSAPVDIDTTQAFPLTVWLHGGEGTARESLAGSRPIIGISPQEGILLAHNDDLVGWRDTFSPNPITPSWHFGYRKNWDPFTPGNLPTTQDTVINYTQRRYLWIDDWVIRHFNVDTTRININGHSMGGAGTTALAKCYPRHYASATVFNNGFDGPGNDQSAALFGSPTDDFYTSLTNRAGQKVKFRQVWNIIDNCSPERDWPPFRVYHSKNDDNGIMRWDANVVENYRKADSLGMGVQLYWSERSHGVDTGPDYNDHWHNGNLPSQQTGYDNTGYEEAHFDSEDWLPAFFNHRLQPGARDPGDGTQGIGPNGVGDDWGTWGGYHRWEKAEVEDGFYSHIFKANLWLEDSSAFINDNCPVDSLVSDVCLRRFTINYWPACGVTSSAGWFYDVNSLSDGYYDYGQAACFGQDNVIEIENLKVFKAGIRKIELTIYLIVPTTSVGPTPFTASLAPNPANEISTLNVTLQTPSQLAVNISDVNGRLLRKTTLDGQSGENRLPLEMTDLAKGMYFVQVVDERGSGLVMKLVRA